MIYVMLAIALIALGVVAWMHRTTLMALERREIAHAEALAARAAAFEQYVIAGLRTEIALLRKS